MNAKRWFAWACLALMLVSEIFLFRANHERDQALTDLRDAQRELADTKAKLDELQNSSTGRQADELAGLRKQNEALNARASALQKNVDRLQAESQQTSQHLTTARTALQLQQEHLEQLKAEQQQAAQLANANACINNLRQIDAAKQQWALEKNKDVNDVPTAQDLLPYLKNGIFPVCPDGGSYSINAMSVLPRCSIPGHVLPAQ